MGAMLSRTLLTVLFSLLVMHSTASANPIYVFKEADGTIRFTDKPPPKGIKTEIFTGKGSVTIDGASRGNGVTFSRASLKLPARKLYTREYDHLIRRAATYHGVDPQLVRAVIHAESAFNPHAVSPKGAKGLMQLMPGTAQDMGVVNVFNPADNIWAGTKYLRHLLERFKGDTTLAVAAYNAGFANVDQYGGIPPFTETRHYVRRVLALRGQYRASHQG